MPSCMVQEICQICIMDATDPDILFYGAEGCSNCIKAKQYLTEAVHTSDDGQRRLQNIISAIKKSGEGKPYDCLIGLSGGVDSTFAAIRLKELGLRPLALHLDNGWNSELAVSNIEKTIKAVGLDLVTHVVDYEEIKDLQRAFFEASLINIEIVTDHAIVAAQYKYAIQHGIRYIIHGGNAATESILPARWTFNARDSYHLRAIHKRFGGGVKLKTFPYFTLLDYFYYTFIKDIKFVPILNYAEYNKAEVVQRLQSEIGWQPYRNKHGESIFTRFFQEHYLPHKFNIDKRKAHLSSLIAAGQMTRDEALARCNEPLYRPDELERDIEYVAKKLDYTPQQFMDVIARPKADHFDFPNHASWIKKAAPIRAMLRRKSLQD